MDKKLYESYLDLIGGFVVEDEKIITYKSLSKSLGIHVNTAKQLLYSYLQLQKCNKTFPICATYLVGGRFTDGSLCVTIVNEEDLEAEKSNFKDITTQHVFSIQKGKNIKDIKILCGIGSESPKKSDYVISCNKCALKDGNKSEKIHTDRNDLKQDLNIKVDATEYLPEKDKNERDTKYINPVSQQKSNLMESKSRVDKVEHSKKPKQAGNINNFFQNASQKKLIKPKEIETKIQGNDKSSLGKENSNRYCENVIKQSETVINAKKQNQKSKRKRIQCLSDSEDSDNNKDEETLPQVVTEENDSCIKISDDEGKEQNNDETTPRNKKKKRKMVDVTVMSEDGYLETRKEMKEVSDSENEEALPPAGIKHENKAKIGECKIKGAPSSMSKKQSSLLTFFKKN